MGLNAMELFPTAVRGTGYGIAAGKHHDNKLLCHSADAALGCSLAFGKVGATVGTLAFQPMQDQMGNRGPFLVGSAIVLVTSVVAFFCLPDVGPDYLAEEDASFKEYLAGHGYDISQFGLDQTPNYSSTTTATNNAAGNSNANAQPIPESEARD